MDLTSAKHKTDDLKSMCDILSQLDEIPVTSELELQSRISLQQKIQEEIQKIMDHTNIISPPVEISHPLLPIKVVESEPVQIHQDEWNEMISNPRIPPLEVK